MAVDIITTLTMWQLEPILNGQYRMLGLIEARIA